MAIYTRPSFPFYPDRFLGGTTLMSSAAVGAYIRMLGVSWNSGPIPATKAALVRAMGLSQLDPPYADLWAEIEPKWQRTPDGWTNETLEGIRADAETHSLDQSARAKSGASKRRKPAGVAPESSRTAAGIQPEPMPEVSRNEAEAPAGVAPESSLRFRSSVSSSSSSSNEVPVQRDPEPQVQSARAVPRDFDSYRQNLKAAAYAYLAEYPEGDDIGMAKAVRSAAQALHVYDFTGKKINGIVYEVRGYLAKAERDAAVTA